MVSPAGRSRRFGSLEFGIRRTRRLHAPGHRPPWAPAIRLGVAIIPAFTPRGPALPAMSAASPAEAAPGRFAMGIGTSSNVIVEGWKAGMASSSKTLCPRSRLRETIRRVLAGEKIEADYESLSIRGHLQMASVVEPPGLSWLRCGRGCRGSPVASETL